ncbi:hypothetical protein HBA_0688 [Sodalis endosymbiont of Henestaris halophilus]|nr:hypothetical protein HBA_0688 [Sodalis endosymbiont of Henestaris halophilus]
MLDQINKENWEQIKAEVPYLNIFAKYEESKTRTVS